MSLFILTEKRIKGKEYRDRGLKPVSIGQKVWFRRGHRKWSPADVIAAGSRIKIIIIHKMVQLIEEILDFCIQILLLRNCQFWLIQILHLKKPIVIMALHIGKWISAKTIPKTSDDSGLVRAAYQNLKWHLFLFLRTKLVCQRDTDIKTCYSMTVKKPD